MGNTDWSKFATLKVVIVFASLILLFFATVFTVGIKSKKNIEFFWMKFSNCESVIKHDTIETIKYDTVIKYTSITGKSSLTTTNQPDKNSKNEANQNLGMNNGNIGGTANTNNSNNHTVNGINNGINGDVFINTDKVYTEEGKKAFLNYMSDFSMKNQINNKTVFLAMQPWSNGKKLYFQLKALLEEKGYNVVTAVTFMDNYSNNVYNGINIYNSRGTIFAVIGMV